MAQRYRSAYCHALATMRRRDLEARPREATKERPRVDRSLQSDDLVVRPDLVDAHERAWAALAAPGTWLTGAERVAVAGEIRQARHCAVCARIRESLSPNTVSGPHTTLGSLPAAAVEVIHRVVNDPGRLSDAWVQSTLAQGISEEQYVEIIGIVAMVMIMDTCARAL